MTNLIKINKQDYGISDFLANFNSEQTRRAYRKDIEDFFSFLASANFVPTHPKDVKTSHFLSYRDFLKSSGKTSATINRKFSTIRSLWSWFLCDGHVTIDPTKSIKLPKSATQKPTQAFTDEEVMRMLCAPNVTTFRGAMHRMAMVLLFHTGLRASELVNARWSDIYEHQDMKILKVVGKGGKMREIPLSETVCKELEVYNSKLVGFTINDPILRSSTISGGTPCNTATIYKMIKRYAKSLGIDKEVSPHSCRATVITKSLENNAPITEVADLAGHSSITTTQIYWKRRKGFESSPVHNLDYTTK